MHDGDDTTNYLSSGCEKIKEEISSGKFSILNISWHIKKENLILTGFIS